MEFLKKYGEWEWECPFGYNFWTECECECEWGRFLGALLISGCKEKKNVKQSCHHLSISANIFTKLNSILSTRKFCSASQNKNMKKNFQTLHFGQPVLSVLS
jgi:hypothetical protein